jgi:hypothetical protein
VPDVSFTVFPSVRRKVLVRNLGLSLFAATILIGPVVLYALGNPQRVLASDNPYFVVTAPSTTTAGAAFNVTVTAYGVDDNPDPAYTGTIQFTSGDPYPAILPAAYTFLPGDNGTHTFTDEATLYTTPSQTITVTDDKGTPLLTDDRTGTSAAIAVTPSATLGAFSISAPTPSPVVAGTAFSVGVAAYDEFGNVKTDYTGPATLTGSLASPGCSAAVCGGSGLSSPAGVEGTTGTWSGGTAPVTGITTYRTGSTTYTVSNGGSVSNTRAFIVSPSATLGAFSISAPTPSPVVAGTAFSVGVTAYDEFGNVKTDYTGPWALVGLSSSPGWPDHSGTLPNYGSAGPISGGAVTFSGVKAFDAASNTLTVQNHSGADRVANSATFTVGPAVAANLLFSADPNVTFAGGQPIDTKFGAKIYSSCVSSAVGSADPCTTASTPVKVLAIDAYGNRVPNVSIAIGTTPNVASFTGDTPQTTSNGIATSVPYGEAWFSTLSIGTISGTKTDAYTLGASATGAAGISESFRIVSDLANCVGQTTCTNKTTNNSIQKPENTFSQVKATSGTLGIVQTTNFSDPSLDVDGQCTTVRGKSKTIGNAVDVRLVGAIGTSAPTTTMLMMIKQQTLKFYGISSRNAASFNVCLGAKYLPETGTPTRPWWGIDKQGKAKAATQGLDADLINRYWGVLADCSASFIVSTYDPCVQLKTKSASALAAQMSQVTGTTWTVSDVNTKLNFYDGDVAILQRHPYPWDGKGGSF